MDGNPEEESHRRCVRARVNDSETESREPAEETEDLSRRQFGLTDLILLSRTLLLRLRRSLGPSPRAFSPSGLNRLVQRDGQP